MARLRTSAGIGLHGGSRYNPLEFFEKGLYFLKELGFDAADIPSFAFLAFGDEMEKGIEDMLAISEKAGIRAELCHLPFGIKPTFTSEEVEAFNASVYRSMDGAKRLGVDFAVLHPNSIGMPMAEYDAKKERESVIAHLMPFAEYANKIGLEIVVENMRKIYANEPMGRFCCDPEELCSVADELGIGICWDFGHAHISGLKQSEALAYVGKRLKMLHVNDNFTREDAHVTPFVGTIDWQDAMQGLKAVGFDGLFNYEVGGYRMPKVVREDFGRCLYKTAQVLLDMMEE